MFLVGPGENIIMLTHLRFMTPLTPLLHQKLGFSRGICIHNFSSFFFAMKYRL